MLENWLKWLLSCAHKVLVVVEAFLVALPPVQRLAWVNILLLKRKEV
jgi:hypothetical protein